MKVLIAGGTGLIGNELSNLLQKSGCDVIILTRNKSRHADEKGKKFLQWDAVSIEPINSVMQEIDAIINLVGENIGSGLWTTDKKKRIIQSRVQAGKALTAAILQANKKPKVFIQSSAVGYYGTSIEETFDETSPNGNDFLAEVAKEWENSSSDLNKTSIRRVIIRTGAVLHSHSGMFPLMTTPFKFFIGGPLGSGNQIISWIHIQDEIGAIKFILENDQINGVVNLTAPAGCTNVEFGKIISKTINRPYWFPTPAFILKLILGEMSTLVLDGQNVIPKVLIQNGYEFKFPMLEKAVHDLMKK